MYREVKEGEAILNYMNGKEVLCLHEESNTNYDLSYYLNGLRFLIDEPEPVSAPKPAAGAITADIASVENLIVEPVTAPEEPKEQAIKKKGHSRKKLDIDVPKMQALKDAGWTDAKIADEFGISQSSVWRYLHMEKGEEDESVPNE